MTARTHDLFAFSSLITVATYFPPQTLNITTTLTCLVGCVIGALIPDLDQASNRLWDLLPAGNFIGKLFRNLLLHHRTISHSILGIYLFYLLLSYLIPHLLNPGHVDYQIVIISVMIGLISHIFADMLTKDGVPLFFPFSFKIGIPPFKFLRITTGNFVEKFIIFPGITIYILWFIIAQKDIFLSLVKLIST
jgi:inner membrane protein